MKFLNSTSLRYNLLANFVGRVWTAALGFLFIPVFVRYLGVEAYALIGFYAALQAVLGVMDLGLGITLNREMARLALRPDARRPQRDLLRTLEVVYWAASILVGLLVVLLARPFAEQWVQVQTLPVETVVWAVRVMGIILALQFPFGFYQGGLMGLQRQILLNTILVSGGTLRSVGAAALLVFVAPSILLFFAWQLFVVALQTGATLLSLWRILGGLLPVAHFRSDLLRSVWRYSAVVSANAFIGVLVTQLDKVLLTRLVPLSDLGYYSIAASVAAVPWMVILPVNAAFYPRFAQAAEEPSEDRLAELYHRAAQLVSVTLLPLCLTLMFFSREFVFAWTGDPQMASRTAVVLTLLVAGTMLNGIASPAGYVQFASGWPELTMYTNAAAAVLVVPAMIYATRRYGLIGAASVWVLLNSFYVLFTVPLMHRRLLRGEKWRWYLSDVALPLTGVCAVVFAAHHFIPAFTSRTSVMLYLGVTGSVCIITAAMLCSEVRRELGRVWSARPSLMRGMSR